MEQLLNNLPSNPRHITWRGIALIVIALMVAIGFSLYAGGFAMLARIFGSHAGTESTFVLAGLTNLENSKGSADWLVPDSQAVFNGTGAFSNFTGVPDYIVPDSLESGLIMPVVTSLEPTQDTFVNHQYASAATNLRQTGVAVNTIKIYVYLPATAQATFAYRTDDAAANLDKSETHQLAPTFAALPENEKIQSATIQLNRELKQYLQLTVDFTGFDPIDRPAVYGWIITYGQSINTPVPTGAALTLTYSGGPNIPTTARIQLLASDISLNPIYNEGDVDLTSRNGEYTVPLLKLWPGAYTAVITSSTTQTKIVPFLVETGQDTLSVALGAFEVGTSEGGADLNGDGKINSLDIQLLFEQYGKTTP